MLLDGCQFFELTSLQRLAHLKTLLFVGRKAPVPLSLLSRLPFVEVVWLNDCPVDVDRTGLGMPRLRELCARASASKVARCACTSW